MVYNPAADIVRRQDHFAHLREPADTGATAPVPATLEYDKYKITPTLLSKLEEMTLTHARVGRMAGLDDILRHHVDGVFRDGQLDMIQMLKSLMETQESQT